MTLLFHDTHHRMVSDPEAMSRFDLSGYDGILAFGATLAEIYRKSGWDGRTFVWHEAADLHLFRPPEEETERHGVVWIGNWGDDRSEEHTSELQSLMRISYAVFCLKKKNTTTRTMITYMTKKQ